MLFHRKFVSLTFEGRGGLLTLMLIGHAAKPGWLLGDRETVELLLRREGCSDAAGVLDELLQRGWLDEEEGELWLHDADDWQRKPSDHPEAVKRRVRAHRARKRGETPGNAPETAETQDRQTDRQTGEDAPAGTGNGLPPEFQTNDLYKLYRVLAHEEPDARRRKWMDDLTVQLGEGEMGRKAVAEMMRQWPGTGDLLGWTSAKLRGGQA
jgi:hypothetical protein